MTITRAAHHLLRKWAAAVKDYEEADATFKQITKEYLDLVSTAPSFMDRLTRRRRYLTFAEARLLARQDPVRKDAAGDRVHYAAEATMYAVSAQLELELTWERERHGREQHDG